MPGAGCLVPARQERWDTFPRSAADWPAAVPGPFYSFQPLPPQARPGLPPPHPQPWPGAQPGPGGQSYCKRPGRPEAWTLPAGQGCCRLPLPGSASLGRVLRPPSCQQATPMAEGGVTEETQALPRACRPAPPESRPSAPSWDTVKSPGSCGRSWQGEGVGGSGRPGLLLLQALSLRGTGWGGAEVGCHSH